MKVYAAMGYTNLESCLEFVRQEELSYVDSTDYTIDEIDGVTFVFGPGVEEEFKSNRFVVGACNACGDIGISIDHCKAIAELTCLPLETVVKFVLHHEDYHRRYDYNGGSTLEKYLDADIEEHQVDAESEINADLHSVKINGLSIDTYLKLRAALREYVERSLFIKVSPLYDNIEENVIKRLGASVEA